LSLSTLFVTSYTFVEVQVDFTATVYVDQLIWWSAVTPCNLSLHACAPV